MEGEGTNPIVFRTICVSTTQPVNFGSHYGLDCPNHHPWCPPWNNTKPAREYESAVRRLARVIARYRNQLAPLIIWRETPAQHHRGGSSQGKQPFAGDCYPTLPMSRARQNWRNMIANPIMQEIGVPILFQNAYSSPLHFMHAGDCTHYCSPSEFYCLTVELALHTIEFWWRRSYRDAWRYEIPHIARKPHVPLAVTGCSEEA